jgi:hypothetical protein
LVLPVGPGGAHQVETTELTVEYLPDNATTRGLLRIAPPHD